LLRSAPDVQNFGGPRTRFVVKYGRQFHGFRPDEKIRKSRRRARDIVFLEAPPESPHRPFTAAAHEPSRGDGKKPGLKSE